MNERMKNEKDYLYMKAKQKACFNVYNEKEKEKVVLEKYIPVSQKEKENKWNIYCLRSSLWNMFTEKVLLLVNKVIYMFID